jgi:hypothetical protein
MCAVLGGLPSASRTMWRIHESRSSLSMVSMSRMGGAYVHATVLARPVRAESDRD